MAAGNQKDNVLNSTGLADKNMMMDDLNMRALKCCAFDEAIERAMKNTALYSLKSKVKNSCRVKYFLINLPIIRHFTAIFEALIMLFWRNYFGEGTYIRPDEADLDAIYDVWSGSYTGRNDDNYSNKEIRRKVKIMAKHIKNTQMYYLL